MKEEEEDCNWSCGTAQECVGLLIARVGQDAFLHQDS